MAVLLLLIDLVFLHVLTHAMPVHREAWNVSRSQAGATGYVIAIGGAPGSTSVFKYSTVANDWTSAASLPDKRMYLAATTLNGAVYAVGGSRVNDPIVALRSTLKYTPSTNT
jgi:hypothetical protein